MYSCSFVALACVAAVSWCQAADATGHPAGALDYREVRGLLLSNLVGASEVELDAAAARGLIEQLPGRVTLLTNGAAAPSIEPGPGVAGATMFGPSSAYIRLAQVNEKADSDFVNALKDLGTTNKLDGLVLDLRFAAGTNYAAAARLVGQFLTAATPVMSLGGHEFTSAANASAVTLPTMVLVNRRTVGAAEALAEALRQNEVALILGSRTAGAAGVFQEFPLSTGQRLRIVTATVKLRDGVEVPPGGVIPDISVQVGLAEERSYLEKPYAPAGGTNAVAPSRPARLTEADLVRMRREGRETRSRVPSETAAANLTPVVADPVLARALDLLKGISLVKPPRRL